MKKLIIAVATLFFINGLQAQKIDRSKPPKAGPAPAISIKDPMQFKLKNGMTVLVVEDHKLPKVSASLYIDRGPIAEGAKAGVISLMGEMLSEGTTSKSKDVFDKEVDQMGADVNLGSSGGGVSALTRYFDKVFMLMSDAVRNPAMEESSFDKLKSQMLTGLKTIDKSAKAISSRVVNALSYGKESPMGEFETEESVSSIHLDDVKKAYKEYITPSRSYLTFIGDITPSKAKALAEKAFGNWTGAKLQLPKLAPVKNPAATEIDLIDVPTAVQSEVTVTNLVSIPLSSPDYFAAIMANQILGGGSNGRLFANLREKHGFTYGAYSSVGSGRFQSTFKASASVRNEKADSAVGEFLSEINRIRTQKVTAKELADAKALYNGNFALSLERPATTAQFASTILLNGLNKDFYRTYLQKINKVTIEDVQRAADKYFNYDNTRVVVVGKSDVVKPGLEKLGYPVKEFDKLAEPVSEKPQEKINISADEIISKYLNAIGGVNALQQVKSVHSTGTVAVQGMNLNIDQKEMAPNLSLMTLEMNGQQLVKNVFDGKAGYMEQMGNKSDFSEDQVKEKADTKGLFNQMFYKTSGFKLEVAGTDMVNGKKAYKVDVTSPSGKKSTEWYDVENGFLVKSNNATEVNGQSISQTSELSDYRKVDNIYLPFTISLSTATPAGSQDMVVKLEKVTVNEEVTAEDFK